MDVLLAVTSSGLKYGRAEAADWDCASRYLTVTTVPAPVTIVSLTRAIQAADYDGLVVIGHGGPGGILLEDDPAELLDYPTLAPLLRGRIPYLVLNTCSSQALADRIAQDTGATVICSIGEVEDRSAYAMGSMLAYWLDGGHSFEEAASLAVPRDQSRGFKLVQPPPPVFPPVAQDGGMFRRYHMAA